MSEPELSRALAKRIIKNLGIGTNKGVLADYNKINYKLKIQEDNNTFEYDIYCAECNANEKIQILFVDIGNEIPDYTILIIQTDSLLVLRFCDNNLDPGSFFSKYENNWIDMSTLYKLNLCSAIEMITQNGYFWGPVQNAKELYDLLVQILSEDYETNDFIKTSDSSV